MIVEPAAFDKPADVARADPVAVGEGRDGGAIAVAGAVEGDPQRIPQRFGGQSGALQEGVHGAMARANQRGLLFLEVNEAIAHAALGQDVVRVLSLIHI